MSVPGLRVVVRGGGDLGSGVVVRLHRAGMKVLVAELAHPLVVRRKVAFAEAVLAGSIDIEGVVGKMVETSEEAFDLFAEHKVPVLVDRELKLVEWFRPQVIVDARLLKRAPEQSDVVARMVIGLGPGFTAGVDCDAVIETMRGPTLGRVIWQGQTVPDSGLPESVMGYSAERVLKAPQAGQVRLKVDIGERVREGQLLAEVDGAGVYARFDGVVRGIVSDGLVVPKGMKIGDIDPRGKVELCTMVSDKALAIGGGVMEAVLSQQIFRQLLGEGEG
jgi:xanthine dehydrogenase accessory factor